MSDISTQIQTKYVEMQLRISAQFSKISKKLGITAKQDAHISKLKITDAINNNDTEAALIEIADYKPAKLAWESPISQWFEKAIEHKNTEICTAMISAGYGHRMDADKRSEHAHDMVKAQMTDALMAFDKAHNVIKTDFKDYYSGYIARDIAKTSDVNLITTVLQSPQVSQSCKNYILDHATCAENQENITLCLENGASYQHRSLYTKLIKNDQIDMAVFVTKHVLEDGDHSTPMDAIKYAEEQGRDALALALRKIVHQDTGTVEAWAKLADDTAILKQHDPVTNTTLTQIFNTTDETVITSVNDMREDKTGEPCIKEDVANMKPAAQENYKKAAAFLAQKK